MGTFSFRNFELGEQFKREFEECSNKKDEKYKCQRAVRMNYRQVESGRLSEMSDKIHSFISHLDEDEVVSFKSKFPEMVKIANEFAIVEELIQF